MIRQQFAIAARVRYVAIAATAMSPFFIAATPFVVHCVAGLPEGALLKGVMPIDAGDGTTLLAFLYEHDSFDLIPLDGLIPQQDVTTQVTTLPVPPPPTPGQVEAQAAATRAEWATIARAHLN